MSNWFVLLNSIQSETPFDGAYGNLKRLFDKAAKMYHQVKKQEMKKLSPSRQRCVSSLLYTYKRPDEGMFCWPVLLCSHDPTLFDSPVTFICLTAYSKAPHKGFNITTSISTVIMTKPILYNVYVLYTLYQKGLGGVI